MRSHSTWTMHTIHVKPVYASSQDSTHNENGMSDKKSQQNELHLFAGAGGGILGGMLLGHRCVCAVEIDPYCRDVLLRRQHNSLLVLDHHQTAKEQLEGLPYCRFEPDKSGAVMAWEHFFPNEPVPVFMQYLQDRDLWRWALNGSREINAAIASYPHEFEVWEWISGLWRKRRFGTVQTEALCELEKQGEVCLRLVAQYVDRVLSKHHCARLDTRYRLATPEPRERIQERDLPPEVHYVPAANSGLLQSEVCEALLKQYEQAPFVACYFRVENGGTVWSLRSRADFDCSAVAKAFGGGGHRQAAGFTTR